MKNFLFLLSIYLLSITNCEAQNQHEIDSLLTDLGKAKEDTSKANTLYELSSVYWDNNPNKAMNYARQCLELSQRIGYKKRIASAYNSIGIIMRKKGDYLSALKFHKKALQIRIEIDYKAGISGSYASIGDIFATRGNYPRALEYFLAALKVSEEIKDKKLITTITNRVGIIYDNQSNYSEALKNYLVALKIAQEINSKNDIADIYNNIGGIYSDLGNINKALMNYSTALKIQKELGNKNGIAVGYNNLAEIYWKQDKKEEALQNNLVALKIREDIEDKFGMASSYVNIGKIYTSLKEYKEATKFVTKGLSISKEIGSLKWTIEGYEIYTKLDSTQGNYKQSLEHYKLYTLYKDSLFNEESTKKITQIEMQYDFDKKETEEKASEKAKEEALHHKEQMQYLGIFCIIIFVFSLLFLLSRFQISLKTIDFIGFIGVLMFFQFLEAIMHPYVSNYTHGNPMFFMATNIALASMIKPLHHFLEKKLIKYSHDRAEKSKFYNFQKKKHAKILARGVEKKRNSE